MSEYNDDFESDDEEREVDHNFEDLQNDQGGALPNGRTTLNRLMEQVQYEKSTMEGWCELSKINAQRMWFKYQMLTEAGFTSEQAMELINNFGSDPA